LIEEASAEQQCFRPTAHL